MIGTLPASYANMGIVYLDLSWNYLSGQLPPEWCSSSSWQRLAWLNLGNNALNGAICVERSSYCWPTLQSA